MILSVPQDQALADLVIGFVSIKEAGHIVIECPIGSGLMAKSGNIGPVGSQNYDLSWPTNTGADTKGILRGRHTYDVTIRFSTKPPEGSSLWITWLQRGRD